MGTITRISMICCMPECNELAFVHRKNRHGQYFRLCEKHFHEVENVACQDYECEGEE